ncbi:TrpB-like pyridoxal phosphate-dependent enzyme [Candidatus Micrarchaeota archaeon]|nr:TrpB-like pyridoxal phosphate-dependent enzyme [Candidatus Micrarchaeota archaeon]
MTKDIKIVLDVDETPKNYYNLAADLPSALHPPLNPATKEPVNPSDLEVLFPKELIKQEVSRERYIPIPEEVRDALIKMGRPSPLFRASRLEKALKTPAKIYFKHEGLNPCGSHKPNTAIAQAYYNMKEGIENLTTETGAGQWGTALSYAGALFDLDVMVFMVRVSFEQKPYRKTIMETYGGEVFSSPSSRTDYGRSVLSKMPDTPGSLGIAISEAVELAAKDDKTHYALGSVLNHVMLHQTVIGQEVQKQLKMIEEEPDVLIGCIGGGSNFAGFSFPFLQDKIKKKMNYEIIAVEPSSCPSTTKGEYRYDFGDSAGLTPLLKMYTLGNQYVPPPDHAGGLRYHGMAPLVSSAINQGYAESVAYDQNEVFKASMLFAETEGIVAAPESAHAIKCCIDKAVECRKNKESKTIVFNLSGHGLMDLKGYEQYLKGML